LSFLTWLFHSCLLLHLLNSFVFSKFPWNI
jgi:hypothetical protein